ncbi:MAG: DUF3303 family protein [Chloroflexi bacterium]|nr:DUF3303 family protein [Chloroflexota bacterium]
MLFLTYWELNENMSVEERQQIAGKLTASGLFPPKGVNIIRWDSTPDGWGIIVAEAETAADIFDAVNLWRTAGAGFFKFTKTSPAEPVQEVLPRVDGLLKSLASA